MTWVPEQSPMSPLNTTTPPKGHQYRGFVVIFTSIFLSLLTTLAWDVAVAGPSTTTTSTSLLVVLFSFTAVPVACRHHLVQVLGRLRAWARLEDEGNRWLVGGRGKEGERPMDEMQQPATTTTTFVNRNQPYINKSAYRTWLNSSPYLAKSRGFTVSIFLQTNIKANIINFLVCLKAHLWII